MDLPMIMRIPNSSLDTTSSGLAFENNFQKVRTSGSSSAFTAAHPLVCEPLVQRQDDTWKGTTVEKHKAPNHGKKRHPAARISNKGQRSLDSSNRFPKTTVGTNRSTDPVSSPPLPTVHQDKRFTGAKGEVRCVATTTRGRECAYIAVNGTNYCCMHVDYDTNPPPRRGGKHQQQQRHGTTTTTTTKHAAVVKMKKTSRSVSNVSEPSVSVKVANNDRKRRSTAEKLAQKHADSPFPLLSMISSDQWANKRVRISMGPFQGYVGHVEKWSNGWVGVRIADVGLHNRRSFELYLDEDLSQVPHNQAPLVHNVPRDTVTPSPHIVRTPSPKQVGVTTPRDVVPSQHQPITPNPTMDESDSYTNRGKSIKTVSSASSSSFSTLPPQVTPTDTRTAVSCLDSSKLESLLSTQESNDDSAGLDLLFGSAALDRSRRRTIRRPTVYQDTEVLHKKRNRKVSL
jgi:hypothetical protein